MNQQTDYRQMSNEALKEAYKAARTLFYNATRMQKPANDLYWMIDDMEQELARRDGK
jgi:hypothetical protein